jgi:hypothetical protein
MIKFYRVNIEKKAVYKNNSYFKNFELDITDKILTIVSDGEIFKYTIDDLRAKRDRKESALLRDVPAYGRYVFAFERYRNNNEKSLKYHGEFFNHYERSLITKGKVKDISLLIGKTINFCVWVTPEAQDFSNLTFALFAYPEQEIKITGVKVQVVEKELFLDRELSPKFTINGSLTIKSNTKETYTIVYDTNLNANFRVKFGNNIGIINKKDTYLVNGKTKVTVDASDLEIGEEIQLEVGTYEFTNTSRIKIRVI